MGTDIQTHDLGSLLALHESDISRQVATARAFPRSPARASDLIQQYATMNEDVAAECNYCIPRDGKVVQGPSVRLAEIVGSCWGNASYASRIIDETETFVIAQAVFMDFEINTRVQVEVQRRIVNAKGERYKVDMIGTTSQAAMSIAMRNAIFKGVPRAVWGEAYSKSRAMVAGTIETLDKRRSTALEQFKKLGATDAMVLQLLDRKGVRDIEPDDLVTLRGVLTAIRDGESTFRTVFGNMEMDGGRSRDKADVGGAVKRGKDAAANRRDSEQADQKDAAGDASRADDAGQNGDGQDVAEGRDDGTAAGDDGVADVAADNGGGLGHDDAAGDRGEKDLKATRKAKDAPVVEGAPLPVADSPKLEDAAADFLSREYGEEWGDALAGLVDELRRVENLKGMNALWDRLAQKFAAAPDEVEQAQQALRSARRKDMLAAQNASRSAAAAKL